MNLRALARAIRALIRMRSVPYVRPPEPTRKDLERKFLMRVDRKGKPTIKEV